LDLEDSDSAPLQATHQELALANAQHLSQYVALNYYGLPGVTFGGAIFTGDAKKVAAPPNAPIPGEQRVTLWEGHARWTPGAWDLSALYAHGAISNLAIANASNLFDAIDQGDILLHHPYESFQPVLELLLQAAKDPQVVAIKQTIYRTGTDSPLMDALMQAARNGKEVTVVVELLARFDEETNINWASQLEAVGAHVVYGVVGHKCHAKMMLIVRRVAQNGKMVLKRYAHLGTGNYHPRTARLYTDFGVMTSDQQVCEDVHHVFQQLTGIGGELQLHRLWQSPFTLHPNLIEAIRAEADNARAGLKARIVAKMNALLEPTVIAALYEASQAGVKIDLIVRGVCSLKPGVEDLSENITVRSIVGRFLEHHRIYYFYAGGRENVYLSSADWMDRNFFRRVEVAFPVNDRRLKRRVIAEGLSVFLGDNQTAWLMQSDGHYKRRRPGKSSRNAQMGLLAKFCG